MSEKQKRAVQFIAQHPGCTAADVRRYEWGGRGHAASYARVNRMRRAGMIRRGSAANGRGIGLYVN